MAAKKGKAENPANEYSPRPFEGKEAIAPLLRSESDRGVILIAVAFVEEIISGLISRVCVSNSLADSLLRVGAPAGDFESRIILGQALGLIHADYAKCLRIIQKVRNKAAHFERGGRGFDVLFDASATADQVVELAKSLGFQILNREPAHVRTLFIDSAMHLAAMLAARAVYCKRPALLKPEQDLVDDTIAIAKGTKLDDIISVINKASLPKPLYNLLIVNFLGAIYAGKITQKSHEDTCANFSDYMLNNAFFNK